MDRLNGGGAGESFFLHGSGDIASGTVEEWTVGPVWGKARLERLWLSLSSAEVVLMAHAIPAPLPARAGLGGAAIGAGERLFPKADQDATNAQHGGLHLRGNDVYELAVGVMVRWAPWWLFMRVHNVGADGRVGFVLSGMVEEAGGLVIPAFWEREQAPHLGRVGYHQSHHSVGV